MRALHQAQYTSKFCVFAMEAVMRPYGNSLYKTFIQLNYLQRNPSIFDQERMEQSRSTMRNKPPTAYHHQNPKQSVITLQVERIAPDLPNNQFSEAVELQEKSKK